jgi:peptidyl-prolyl cis-trans isomerase SurA
VPKNQLPPPRTSTYATRGPSASTALPGQPLDAVVAVANDQPILASDMSEQIAQVSQNLRAQGTSLPPENVLRHQVLERLITQKLELQTAQRKGVQVSADQVNNALSSIAARHDLTLAQLPKALSAQGRNYLAFRRNIKNQLTIHQLEQQTVASNIQVTPTEIDHYIQRQNNAAGGNREYKLAQILVAFPSDATPEQVKKAKEKAAGLVAKIRNGADFAATAVANSDGPHALKGGTIGWIKAANLPTLFEDVVPKLETGAISEPIAGVGGFHIVKLVDKRTAESENMATEYHVRHILLKPNPVRDQAQSKALAEKLHKQIKAGTLTFAQAAKQNSDDPNSAGAGGELDWKTLDDLPPAFRQPIESLPLNQLSRPIETKYGWDMLEVVGKRHSNVSKEERKHKAYQAIFHRKLTDQLAQFRRTLRNQAYIKIFDSAHAGSGDDTSNG